MKNQIKERWKIKPKNNGSSRIIQNSVRRKSTVKLVFYEMKGLVESVRL